MKDESTEDRSTGWFGRFAIDSLTMYVVLACIIEGLRWFLRGGWILLVLIIPAVYVLKACRPKPKGETKIDWGSDLEPIPHDLSGIFYAIGGVGTFAGMFFTARQYLFGNSSLLTHIFLLLTIASCIPLGWTHESPPRSSSPTKDYTSCKHCHREKSPSSSPYCLSCSQSMAGDVVDYMRDTARQERDQDLRDLYDRDR